MSKGEDISEFGVGLTRRPDGIEVRVRPTSEEQVSVTIPLVVAKKLYESLGVMIDNMSKEEEEE